MKPVIWTLRIVLFLVLLALAIKNSGAVTLRFFFNLEWTVPLSVILLGAFAVGALLGVTARLASLYAGRFKASESADGPPTQRAAH